MIWKSESKVKNKITENGALAFPVLHHGFGAINWRLEDIRKNYTKTRRTLTMYKCITQKLIWIGYI